MPRAAKAELRADITCDDDAWAGLKDADQVVQRAASAVAAWPGLISSSMDVSVALSSDEDVAQLNGQFRGKPKPTNVLSFPAGAGAPQAFLGDIVLAAETVVREAAEQGVPVVHHVQHLVIHGILHLIGYDHETPAEADRMEELEIGILASLGIANPYTGDLDIATKE